MAFQNQKDKMAEQTQTLFQKKWLEAVKKKNSILCAGLDPAVFCMDRGEKGLPLGINKRGWAHDYIKAVAPYCAALKPNIQYWKSSGKQNILSKGDMENLTEITELAHSLDMVVIEDSKLADIGSTNDAGFFYAQQKGVDAVTFSPFAGNMEEAVEQAHARGLGLISMCLMSNPGYEREKNKLVAVGDNYEKTDVFFKKSASFATGFIPQYVQLAHDADRFGVDGIVVGAPSVKNHITDQEIRTVAGYFNGLILVPGLGAQGGEAETLFKYFMPDNLIVNFGRALMLPKGSNSTPAQQAETARQYRDMLNKSRK